MEYSEIWNILEYTIFWNIATSNISSNHESYSRISKMKHEIKLSQNLSYNS